MGWDRESVLEERLRKVIYEKIFKVRNEEMRKLREKKALFILGNERPGSMVSKRESSIK